MPSFGAARPRILIIGLAPGLHGANRTGRPFTGDHAGLLLYQTLYDAGLANRPHSHSADDALRLIDVRIDHLRRELESVVKTRALHRAGRKRVPFPVVAIVGYTNAG